MYNNSLKFYNRIKKKIKFEKEYYGFKISNNLTDAEISRLNTYFNISPSKMSYYNRVKKFNVLTLDDVTKYKLIKQIIKDFEKNNSIKLTNQQIYQGFVKPEFALIYKTFDSYVPFDFLILFVGLFNMDNKNSINFEEFKKYIIANEKELKKNKADAIKADIKKRSRDPHMDRFITDIVYPGDKISYILDIYPVTSEMQNGDINLSSSIDLDVVIPTEKDYPSFCNFVPNSESPIQSYILNNNQCEKPSEIDNKFYCTFKYNQGLGVYQQNRCNLARKSYIDFMENNKLIKKDRKKFKVNMETIKLFKDNKMIPRKDFNFVFQGFSEERYELLLYFRSLMNNNYDINKFDLNFLDKKYLQEEYNIILDNSNKLIDNLERQNPNSEILKNAKMENKLLLNDEKYYITELGNRFVSINKGLVLKKDGKYQLRKKIFDFKIFDDARYINLANLRKSYQIQEKDLIKLDKLTFNFNEQNRKADIILRDLSQSNPSFYKIALEENSLILKEGSKLLYKIENDIKQFLKDKLNKYTNPCYNNSQFKNIPLCKKFEASRTIKVHRPRSISGIALTYLDKKETLDLWKNRNSFNWYTEKQFKNSLIVNQDVEKITENYFENIDYVDKLWQEKEIESIYKFSKDDNQEFVNYKIEGKCFNSKTNDKKIVVNQVNHLILILPIANNLTIISII